MSTTYTYLHYLVAFSDTDAMGIMHHSNHIKLFERGRIDFLKQVGLSYRELSERSTHFPVLGVECVYKKPCLFDDLLLIATCLSGLSKTRVEFSYQIFKTQAELPKTPSIEPFKNLANLVATGISKHCCVGEATMPIRIPEALFQSLEKHLTLSNKF